MEQSEAAATVAVACCSPDLVLCLSSASLVHDGVVTFVSKHHRKMV
jgi:hypothetical protein